MTWPVVLVALLVCHLAGDLLLQTEWQAVTKVRGFSDAQGRRALLAHAGTYTLAYLPVLVWIANDRGVLRAVLVAVLIVVPHVTIDDGRLMRVWMHRVKHASDPSFALSLMVDQSFHVLCLLGAAVVATL